MTFDCYLCFFYYKWCLVIQYQVWVCELSAANMRPLFTIKLVTQNLVQYWIISEKYTGETFSLSLKSALSRCLPVRHVLRHLQPSLWVYLTHPLMLVLYWLPYTWLLNPLLPHFLSPIMKHVSIRQINKPAYTVQLICIFPNPEVVYMSWWHRCFTSLSFLFLSIFFFTLVPESMLIRPGLKSLYKGRQLHFIDRCQTYLKRIWYYQYLHLVYID